ATRTRDVSISGGCLSVARTTQYCSTFRWNASSSSALASESISIRRPVPVPPGRPCAAAAESPAGSRDPLLPFRSARLPPDAVPSWGVLKAPRVAGPFKGPFRLLGTGERRSEEHTSELQSRENLVCRLLLEK